MVSGKYKAGYNNKKKNKSLNHFHSVVFFQQLLRTFFYKTLILIESFRDKYMVDKTTRSIVHSIFIG